MTNKWFVLLTTCVNNFDEKEISYRKTLYRKSILKWLNETNLHIVVVESSGWEFPYIDSHPRLHIITFNIAEKLSSSTKYEAISIHHALNELKELKPSFYTDCTHILKVTGRYFLEDISNKLENLDSDIDLYLQIHRDNNIQWQNSEYYGINKNLFIEFIESVKEKLMENALYDFTLDHSYKTIGPFPNNIPRGGDKLIITNL